MGYPGIGKTAVAKDDYRFIDLDSSELMARGRLGRKKGWEDSYCNVALLLSKQGYYVFVSTHPEVVKRVVAKDKRPVVCYPSLNLADAWIERLYERYKDLNTPASHNAWRRANDHYHMDILELSNAKCAHIIVPSLDFNLKKAILELDSYLLDK